jgi:hypothetical protein
MSYIEFWQEEVAKTHLGTFFKDPRYVRKDSKDKPVVVYVGAPDFYMNGDVVQAGVFCLNHPILGSQRVRTSAIMVLRDDASFETVNTMYKPMEESVNSVVEETTAQEEHDCSLCLI